MDRRPYQAALRCRARSLRIKGRKIAATPMPKSWTSHSLLRHDDGKCGTRISKVMPETRSAPERCENGAVQKVCGMMRRVDDAAGRKAHARLALIVACLAAAIGMSSPVLAELDQEPDRRIRRPRQGYRAHFSSRDSDQSHRRVRRAQGDAPGVRHDPAHRDAAYRLLRRGRRDQVDRRGRAHLHRVDVRRKSRPSRRRAPGLRRLAHELQDASGGDIGRQQRERPGAAGRRGCRAAG